MVDIIHWRRPVYAERIDQFIAELLELGLDVEGFLKEHRILWMKKTDSEFKRAETVLSAKRDELYERARTSGWDMESLDERIAAQKRAVAIKWIASSANR